MAGHYADRIAVVTGAGSGIGAAIARALAAQGARVHCVDINADAAQQTADTLRNAQAHQVDVTDAKAMTALATRILAEEDRVDVLCNNAGIGHAGKIADTALEDWRKVLDINVMGVVHGLNAFLPAMQKQGGSAHIVNTASAAGLVAIPRMGPYCASKHAVVGLSQSLAAELRGSGIAVTILCPGIINTPIVERTIASGDAAQGKQHAVDYYAKKGASPDKVAADLLVDMKRKKLFCITPRAEVGVAWLSQRLSPRLAAALTGAGSRSILGLKD